MWNDILITENIIKQWDYLDHDKEIRESWQKRELPKPNPKKAKQNEAFSQEEGIL